MAEYVNDAEADIQYELSKSDFANHLLLAAHAALRCMELAPDGTEITQTYLNPSHWLLQHAEEIRPDGSSFPEYANNVIPITKAMRRKQ